MPNSFRRPSTGFLIALATVAVGLFLRRAAGATEGSLPAGETCVISALFTFAVGPLLDRILPHSAAIRLAPTGAFMIGLTFAAGATGEPLSLLTAAIVTAAATAIVSWPSAIGQMAASQDSAAPIPAESAPATPIASGPSSATADEIGGEPSVGDVSSLTLRRSLRDGEARIDGIVSFAVPVGEQGHAVHVPLWPPLHGDPQVTCELVGLEGRVRTTLAKGYGLRFEIRVAEAGDEPLEGELRFTARAKADSAPDQVAA